MEFNGANSSSSVPDSSYPFERLKDQSLKSSSDPQPIKIKTKSILRKFLNNSTPSTNPTTTPITKTRITFSTEASYKFIDINQPPDTFVPVQKKEDHHPEIQNRQGVYKRQPSETDKKRKFEELR